MNTGRGKDEHPVTLVTTAGSVLESTRLLLRPMEEAEMDALLSILADPKVTAAFNAEPFGREQMQTWAQRNLLHQDKHGYGLFSVFLKSDSVLIGDCGLEHMDLNGESVVELGYDFRSDYWNQGYATEAAGAIRDYALQTLNLPQIVSLIRVGNHASRRVAEKIGMTMKEQLTREGHPYWNYGLNRT